MTSTQIIHGDALEEMAKMPDKSVHCIISDCAYWTLDKWRNIGTTTRLGGHRDEDKREGWFQTITAEELYTFICECYRVLVKDSHCWLMCDGTTLGYILGYAEHGETGFDYYKPYPVLKRAQNGGYKQGMGYHGRCVHEYVVLLEKGRRRFSDENWPDVFEAVWCGDSETRDFTPDSKSYPTAKPLSLFSRWIELSTTEGETVLDPFMGSGTAILAPLKSRRKGVGIDVSEHAIETAKRRIDNFAQMPALW